MRNVRGMMAGNGLMLESHVARHRTVMEMVSTYEGADSLQGLCRHTRFQCSVAGKGHREAVGKPISRAGKCRESGGRVKA